MYSVISGITVTCEVPCGSPITAPSIKRPEQCRPPLDKKPRYKCHVSVYAGPNDYGEHELYISEDQYVRMLRIAHETTGEDAPNGR